MIRHTTAFTAALWLLAGTIEAKPRHMDGAERRGPPQVALDACANATADAECSFTGRRGETVTGICLAPPHLEEAALACAPEGGPPRHRRTRDDAPEE